MSAPDQVLRTAHHQMNLCAARLQATAAENRSAIAFPLLRAVLAAITAAAYHAIELMPQYIDVAVER